MRAGFWFTRGTYSHSRRVVRARLIAAMVASLFVLSACTETGAEHNTPQLNTEQPTAAANAEAGVSEADREFARQIVAQMSDAELAGAVVMTQYASTSAEEGAALIREHHLAGAIVMGYNLSEAAGRDEVAAATDTLRQATSARSWPGLISVDQEGGPVARVRSATLPFPSLMAGGAVRDKSLVTEATRVQGHDLASLGFNVDFAPVADVTVGQKDAAINLRSAGSDQKRVAETVAAAITGYSGAGVASAAKHFPGHGGLSVDSHQSLPVSDKTLAELATDEWEPFEQAAAQNVPMIMVGHIGLPDDEKLPASLNPDVYKQLRDTVGFDGVAVTDALNMGAISKAPGQDALEAIKAGADLALMPTDTAAAVNAIETAVGNGELERSRLEEAATRMVALSHWSSRVLPEAPQPLADSEAADTLSAYAQASFTVLAGDCSFESTDTRFSVTGGQEESRAALISALEELGFTQAKGGLNISIGARSGADVVVGDGAPWEIDRSDAETIITAYSGNEYAMAAVARYLAGELEASAQAPVTVRSDPPTCR